MPNPSSMAARHLLVGRVCFRAGLQTWGGTENSIPVAVGTKVSISMNGSRVCLFTADNEEESRVLLDVGPGEGGPSDLLLCLGRVMSAERVKVDGVIEREAPGG